MKKKSKHGSSKAATDQRRTLFVEAYIANGQNGTQAAISAGYSPKTAHAQACRLLKRAEILAAIKARLDAGLTAASLTTDRVLQELSRIALFDPRKLFHEDGSMKQLRELDDDTAAALASVELAVTKGAGSNGKPSLLDDGTLKFRFTDKNAALEKAMKYHGLFDKDNRQRPLTPATIRLVWEEAPREQQKGHGRPAAG